MQCEIYSRKYGTTIEFWRHYGEIKIRSVDYIPELSYLNYHEGQTLCDGGSLRGSVYGFYTGWSQEQFQRVCRAWWRKFMRRVD